MKAHIMDMLNHVSRECLSELVKEWRNVRVAEIAEDGGIWVEGPQSGHWLPDVEIERFMAWTVNNEGGKRTAHPRAVSCGCCTGTGDDPKRDRCTCHFHQDIFHGRMAQTCEWHRAHGGHPGITEEPAT